VGTGSTSKYFLDPDLALVLTLEQALRAEAKKKIAKLGRINNYLKVHQHELLLQMGCHFILVSACAVYVDTDF
jgi:hypothetical protein